jgi:hypothetical protein
MAMLIPIMLVTWIDDDLRRAMYSHWLMVQSVGGLCCNQQLLCLQQKQNIW